MDKEFVKKERKKLDKYFLFFLFSFLGSRFVGESKIGILLDFLSVGSFILLIINMVKYRKATKGKS